MKINIEILEKEFSEFKNLVYENDGQPFKSFKTSQFIDYNENYKYSVYQEARDNLNNKFWKPEDVGSGKIKKSVESAIKTRVIHNYRITDNNLVDWRLKDDFSKRANNRAIEQLFFDFYKSKIKDQEAYEQLISQGLSYQIIAYLFFIKDSNKYLPISQERFDLIFERLGVSDFRTRNNASWENYIEFCSIIKSVHIFLKEKETSASLLDAHSFLWILGGQQITVRKKENTTKVNRDNYPLPKPDWNSIINNPEITNDYDLSVFQALYSFENHQAYASQIGLILGHKGKTPQSPINLEIGKYAKRIAKHFDIDIAEREKQEWKFWDLFFDGWEDGDFYMWKLKPEIVKVLESCKLTGVEVIPEEIPIEESADLFEGAKKTVTINAYERNPRARSLCIKHWGTICAICGFDFEIAYGEIGKGYIHVHHIVPISQVGNMYQVDPISDLRPVCPNCHAMIHAKIPSLTIEDVKKLINHNT